MASRLLSLDAAATELGVPKLALRKAAERHGLIVRIGRAPKLDPESIPELIELCREKPQERDSTNAATASSLSATAPDSSQRALAIAAGLKARSLATSPKGTGQPAQVHPIK